MMYPLYIDPGTGSAIFSIVIGAAAVAYFLAQALWIKLKVVISGGQIKAGAKNHHPFVIYAEDKRYWNIFKPVTDEFEKRNIELLYLTSSKDDPVFGNNYKYIQPEYIGEGNKAFTRLNLLFADFVLMTTPELNVLQMKRSKMVKHYSHVIHGPTDATTYSMFGLDYFDSILMTGEYQGIDIRAIEKIRDLPEKQLVTVGCGYLDVALEKIRQIPKEENHQFTVLVSPSWGASSLLTLYGEKLLDPLVQTGWRIIVRPHPQSKNSEYKMLESLTEKYKNTKNLEWNYDRENVYVLAKADIMIGDFSGITFDYAFLCDKPVIYVSHDDFDIRPYDAWFLKKELWQFRTLREIGIELREKDFNSIAKIIASVSDNETLKKARRIAKDTAWQYQTESGKRTADFMIETVNEMEKNSA
ncbi:CDP-glycerol glycerophosphotransferase [Spirochaetia bacterium]|nr:CDP-glycerol glycerophosphotransferase [Spirochaetia bacterium]